VSLLLLIIKNLHAAVRAHPISIYPRKYPSPRVRGWAIIRHMTGERPYWFRA
jgi:hypothetical protein